MVGVVVGVWYFCGGVFGVVVGWYCDGVLW